MKSKRKVRTVSVSIFFVLGTPAYPVHFYKKHPDGIKRRDYNVNQHRLDQLLEALGHAKKKSKKR